MPCTWIRFNPRTRVGCDARTNLGLGTLATQFQSTHPRGVRLTAFQAILRHSPFQSTHPRGVRLVSRPPLPMAIWFQSTHPRGVRLGGNRFFLSLFGFQSSHPRGVRLIPKDLGLRDAQVSIHAPAWGATRPSLVHSYSFALVSIHAPAWGATSRMKTIGMNVCKFQSTHPRGVRHAVVTQARHAVEIVSIHAPAWGAT